MKVIKPITITSAMVVSTTAVETYAEYNAATTYALNDRCTMAATHTLYECIQGPSTGNAPDTSPLYWVSIGPTNQWAMFDSEISTQTTAATELTVVLDLAYCNSLALFGLDGQSMSIQVHSLPDNTLIYDRTINLDGTIIADWYQYFFEPYVQLGELVLTDLPPYAQARATITINSSATAKCGLLTAGTFYALGGTEYGATASIIDYSRKDTDAFGITTFVRRAYSKRMSAKLMLQNAQLNKVHSVLADVRATPCVWISTDTDGYNPLTVFGFYRDFSIDVAYPTMSYCSLEIEGLT